jgi:hypothetical protein
VQLSGRVASMGRGIIQDVSARIVDQFSENLAAMLGESGSAAAAPTDVRAAPEEAAPPAGGSGAPRSAPTAEPAQAELSATDLAATIVKGRLEDPRTLGGTLLLVLLIGFLLGRRSG